METSQFLFIVVTGLIIFINQDLLRVRDYISFKLYGGKKLAPKETSFN